LHAHGHVRSREELRHLTRRLFTRHRISPDCLDEIATTTTELIAPTIEMDVTLSEGAKRAIAKMATDSSPGMARTRVARGLAALRVCLTKNGRTL
jgi:hypothetical protein